MAQSLKHIRNRIRSVEGIRKITHAMEMVSSAKMRPLQKMLYSQEEYFARIRDLVLRFLASFTQEQHPLLAPKKTKQRIHICIFASDTGLCGNYNSAIIHKTEEFIRQNKDYQISLSVIGRKALNYFKRRSHSIEDTYTELYGHYSAALPEKITQNLTDIYLSGRADEIYAVYIASSRHEPAVEKILNIEKEKKESIEYLIEPDAQGILEKLIPAYLLAKIKIILLRAFVAENSSRAMAMHESTDNAKELLEDLVIKRNKIRQENITEEIIDIISAVNAMKG